MKIKKLKISTIVAVLLCTIVPLRGMDMDLLSEKTTTELTKMLLGPMGAVHHDHKLQENTRKCSVCNHDLLASQCIRREQDRESQAICSDCYRSTLEETQSLAIQLQPVLADRLVQMFDNANAAVSQRAGRAFCCVCVTALSGVIGFAFLLKHVVEKGT